jgi:hypothetical protein
MLFFPRLHCVAYTTPFHFAAHTRHDFMTACGSSHMPALTQQLRGTLMARLAVRIEKRRADRKKFKLQPMAGRGSWAQRDDPFSGTFHSLEINHRPTCGQHMRGLLLLYSLGIFEVSYHKAIPKPQWFWKTRDKHFSLPCGCRRADPARTAQTSLPVATS